MKNANVCVARDIGTRVGSTVGCHELAKFNQTFSFQDYYVGSKTTLEDYSSAENLLRFIKLTSSETESLSEL